MNMMAQRVSINNLAQSYMCFNTNYHDTGLFGIYAVADPKTQAVDDLVSAHLHILTRTVPFSAVHEQCHWAGWRSHLWASLCIALAACSRTAVANIYTACRAKYGQGVLVYSVWS